MHATPTTGPLSCRPELILFDLDGTLVDSVPDLTAAVDAMLGQLGRAPCGELAVRRYVGNGIRRLIERALTGQMDGATPDPELFAAAEPLFRAHYAAHLYDRSQLYDGVRAGLDWVLAAGYPVGCVTNKPADFAETLLRHLGLWQDFPIVIGGDSLPRHKPDPLPLLHAAKHFGVAPERSLMVGDSVSDVRAARAAGFAVVCTSYGYNHGVDIRDSEPDAVLDSLVELKALLSGT